MGRREEAEELGCIGRGEMGIYMIGETGPAFTGEQEIWGPSFLSNRQGFLRRDGSASSAGQGQPSGRARTRTATGIRSGKQHDATGKGQGTSARSSAGLTVDSTRRSCRFDDKNFYTGSDDKGLSYPWRRRWHNLEELQGPTLQGIRGDDSNLRAATRFPKMDG